MTATTTRTLNPLPFQDLEPHRFEDLIRQLAYDMRQWKSLEATGRSGADDGIDIRAVETVQDDVERAEEEASEDGAGGHAQRANERLWIFQCKREKSLAAKRVREVVRESLASLERPPHGFVLAVACDVSAKTRDAFREEMVTRGIEEFLIWAKSELEDMLFRPSNDRLLFAYFGISLTTRRRTMTTALRSSTALKKQLAALLSEQHHNGRLVLLRDPTDDRYPVAPKHDDSPARWKVVRALHLKTPGHLTVLQSEHLAALTPDGYQWDAINDPDLLARDARSELRGLHAWGIEERYEADPASAFWKEYVPERERVLLKCCGHVALARILGIDPTGDGYFPVPHIFADFAGTSPFSRIADRLVSPRERRRQINLKPDQTNRAAIFPPVLPSEGALPPAGFDDTVLGSGALSGPTSAKLDALIQNPSDPNHPIDERQAVAHAEAKRLKVLAFDEWRDNVAHPTFAAFVSKLREAGHAARVVMRSIAATEPHGETLHSIELRVQLHSGSSYWQSGSLGVSLDNSGNWSLDMVPGRKANDARLAKSTPQMTAEELEHEVLGVLERMKKGHY